MLLIETGLPSSRIPLRKALTVDLTVVERLLDLVARITVEKRSYELMVTILLVAVLCSMANHFILFLSSIPPNPTRAPYATESQTMAIIVTQQCRV